MRVCPAPEEVSVYFSRGETETQRRDHPGRSAISFWRHVVHPARMISNPRRGIEMTCSCKEEEERDRD